MKWLKRYKNGKKKKKKGHINHETSSKSTLPDTILETKRNVDTKEEELLRKVIRRIMIEEGGKLFEEDQGLEESSAVKKEVLAYNKENKALEMNVPVKEGATPSAEKLKAPRPSSSRQSVQREGPHQRSIQDVLAGSMKQDNCNPNLIRNHDITNKRFDTTIKHVFPGALDNYSLIKQISSLLLESKAVRKPIRYWLPLFAATKHLDSSKMTWKIPMVATLI